MLSGVRYTIYTILLIAIAIFCKQPTYAQTTQNAINTNANTNFHPKKHPNSYIIRKSPLLKITYELSDTHIKAKAIALWYRYNNQKHWQLAGTFKISEPVRFLAPKEGLYEIALTFDDKNPPKAGEIPTYSILVDTAKPLLQIKDVNYSNGQAVIRWHAYDENFGDRPIDIYQVISDSEQKFLGKFANTGIAVVSLTPAKTSKLKLVATDLAGNYSIAISQPIPQNTEHHIDTASQHKHRSINQTTPKQQENSLISENTTSISTSASTSTPASTSVSTSASAKLIAFEEKPDKFDINNTNNKTSSSPSAKSPTQSITSKSYESITNKTLKTEQNTNPKYTPTLRKPSKQALEQYKLAQHYKNTGQLNLAKTYLLKAIKLSPDFISAKKDLANILLIEGKYKQAENYFLQIIQLDDHNIPSLEALATINIRRGRYAQAKTYLKRILQTDKNNIKAMLKLGDVYWLMGDKVQAEITWKRAKTIIRKHKLHKFDEAVNSRLELIEPNN